MKIERIEQRDLPAVSELQPPDWPPIVPTVEFYIASAYCDPFKAVIGNGIAGIGTGIRFINTAWLAHIIVAPAHRNRGIGTAILDFLIGSLRERGYDTISLIATEYGEPLYLKAGFRETARYGFFRREGPGWNHEFPGNVVLCNDTHRSMILDLDREVSGEERGALLETHLSNTLVHVWNNKVTGFYMPNLGEGFIAATDAESGIALMRAKYSTISSAVLPLDNRNGVRFLTDNGFVETRQVPRMVLGADIPWQPGKIYGRIGGNCG